ncbi:ribbon-helix-helix domain-containing protein [Demequina sp.]|uniref:ribbon-helix-helix domain-containing protein n=1 Tax=Demequina sp. TaxID=2050685 RepID=UPI003D11E9E8
MSKIATDRTDPLSWSPPAQTLSGEDAAAYGRSVLESAGVDVEELNRRVGRPRVGGARGRHGERSPRVNIAVTKLQYDALLEIEESEGRSRSEIVREALEEYLERRLARPEGHSTP